MAVPINIEVTNDYFGGIEGIKSILNDYYENEISLLGQEEQNKARIFIEEGLIVGGKRVLVSQGVEQQNFGIGPVLLKKLLDSRIVREETTHIGKSYEISHDTLVPPILESFEKRRLQLERERTRRELLEQEAKLKLERRRRRLSSFIAAAFFALFIISVVATVIATRARINAQDKEREAIESKNKIIQITADLDQQKLQTDSIKYFKYINSGKSEMTAGNYLDAIREFQFALDINAERPEADSLINICKNLAGLKANFSETFASAQQAFLNRNFLLSMNKVINAEKIEIDVLSKQKLQNLKDKLSSEMVAEVKSRINTAWVFYERGENCAMAMGEINSVEPFLKYLNKNNLSGEINTIQLIKKNCK